MLWQISSLPLKVNVCMPLHRLVLIKLLLLTTSLIGQLQAIVKSDWSLSHSVREDLYIWEYDTKHRLSLFCLHWTHAELVSRQKVRQTSHNYWRCLRQWSVWKSDQQTSGPQKTRASGRKRLKWLMNVGDVTRLQYSPTHTPSVSSEHCRSRSSRTGTPQTL